MSRNKMETVMETPDKRDYKCRRKKGMDKTIKMVIWLS